MFRRQSWKSVEIDAHLLFLNDFRATFRFGAMFQSASICMCDTPLESLLNRVIEGKFISPIGALSSPASASHSDICASFLILCILYDFHNKLKIRSKALIAIIDFTYRILCRLSGEPFSVVSYHAPQPLHLCRCEQFPVSREMNVYLQRVSS